MPVVNTVFLSITKSRIPIDSSTGIHKTLGINVSITANSLASKADPPAGVSSNSSHIRRLQASGLKRLPCTEPMFTSDAAIVGQHPGVLDVLKQNGFPHGTQLDVGH